MNNPELGSSHTDNNEANQWDTLPKENFYQHRQNLEETPKSELSDDEIRQILIAQKHSERLKNNAEAKKNANRVAAKFLAVAIGATALIGGLIATGPKDDFLKSEQAKQKVIEMENVKEVTFHGNIRSNPETTNSEDTNVYASTDEEVKFSVPEDSTVYYYRDENDPNGGWYGISVEDLEDQSFISKREARKMKKDGDQTVWINDGNASVTTE